MAPCQKHPVPPTTKITIMILHLQTDRFGQTVQTQIRLLLEEQSDQGLHCLLLNLHYYHLKYHTIVQPLSLNFRMFTENLVCIRKCSNFTVSVKTICHTCSRITCFSSFSVFLLSCELKSETLVLLDSFLTL